MATAKKANKYVRDYWAGEGLSPRERREHMKEVAGVLTVRALADLILTFKSEDISPTPKGPHDHNLARRNNLMPDMGVKGEEVQTSFASGAIIDSHVTFDHAMPVVMVNIRNGESGSTYSYGAYYRYNPGSDKLARFR